MDDLIQKAKQAKPNIRKRKKYLADLMPVVDELRKNGLIWKEVKEWLEENAGVIYEEQTLVHRYNNTGPYAGKDWRDK